MCSRENLAILDETHKEQAIDILTKQFSASGGNLLSYPLNCRFQHDDLTSFVDHAIQTEYHWCFWMKMIKCVLPLFK